MLTACVVCLGVTVVGQDGFPSRHEPAVWNPVMRSSNVGVCIMVTEQEAEVLQGTRGKDTPSQPASYTDIYSPASQLDQWQEILSRLPEHLRCVLPPEKGNSANDLTLSQLEDAVKLGLTNEDCFPELVAR